MGMIRKRDSQKEAVVETCAFIAAVIVAVGCLAYTALVLTRNENEEITAGGTKTEQSESSLSNTALQSGKEDIRNQFLESVGAEESVLTDKIVSESGEVNDIVIKDVKEYRTLADAESDMGCYFGLHNTLESIDNIELVYMANVGNGYWYQAVYETADTATTITVKLSLRASAEEIASVYELDSYEERQTLENKGNDIIFLSDKIDMVNVCYFEVLGRSYVIYSADGISSIDAVSLANEVIFNVESM